MFLICLISAIFYFVHVRYIKFCQTVLWIMSGCNYACTEEYLQMWRILFVFCHAVPVGLIMLLNILLLFNIINHQKQMKTLKANITATSRKELKATILILILTISFLIGTVANVSLDMFTSDDPIVKDRLENLLNMAEISTIITILMESINIIIYYAKIKKFRVRCNKMIRSNL